MDKTKKNFFPSNRLHRVLPNRQQKMAHANEKREKNKHRSSCWKAIPILFLVFAISLICSYPDSINLVFTTTIQSVCNFICFLYFLILFVFFFWVLCSGIYDEFIENKIFNTSHFDFTILCLCIRDKFYRRLSLRESSDILQ